MTLELYYNTELGAVIDRNKDTRCIPICIPIRDFHIPIRFFVNRCTPISFPVLVNEKAEIFTFLGNSGILTLISSCVAMVKDQYEAEVKAMLLGTLDQILVVKENREDILLYNRLASLGYLSLHSENFFDLHFSPSFTC